ncbi:MAG: acyl carrier protein [bacterium]|nr:acyl carrier protein [bacterium]
MTRDEILHRIAEVARDKLELKVEVRPETRLVEDLELDSIRLLTLAMEVEDRFEICLDEEDEEGIVTVADLVDVVGRKLAA